jgi:hypothetical protein
VREATVTVYPRSHKRLNTHPAGVRTVVVGETPPFRTAGATSGTGSETSTDGFPRERTEVRSGNVAFGSVSQRSWDGSVPRPGSARGHSVVESNCFTRRSHEKRENCRFAVKLSG